MSVSIQFKEKIVGAMVCAEEFLVDVLFENELPSRARNHLIELTEELLGQLEDVYEHYDDELFQVSLESSLIKCVYAVRHLHDEYDRLMRKYAY